MVLACVSKQYKKSKFRVGAKEYDSQILRSACWETKADAIGQEQVNIYYAFSLALKTGWTLLSSY